MIAHDVSLREIDAVLVGFGQANGAIIESAMRTGHIIVTVDVFAHQVHEVVVTEGKGGRKHEQQGA